MTLYLAYECDAWHTHASKTLISISENRNKLIEIISGNNPEIKKELETSNQTHGLDTNYIIEEVTTDTLMSYE